MTEPMDTTWRCLYASKPCTNARSMKVSGSLHRLCLHHRNRANAAQRRWHTRKRHNSDGGSSEAVASAPQPVVTKRRLLSILDFVTPKRRRTQVLPSLATRAKNDMLTMSVSPTAAAEFNLESMKPITNDAIYQPTVCGNEDFDLDLISEFLVDLGDFTNLPTTVVDGPDGKNWSVANQCFVESTEFFL